MKAEVKDLIENYKVLNQTLRKVLSTLDSFKPDVPQRRPGMPPLSVPDVAPALPPRDDPHFIQLLDTFKKYFPEGVSYTAFERARYLASFKKEILKKYRSTHDFINVYKENVDNQLDNQGLVKDLLRLYELLLHDYKDRFDKNFLYKGGLGYNSKTHLNIVILPKNRFALIEKIGIHIAEIMNHIKDNPSLNTAYGNLVDTLQRIYSDIERHKEAYVLWLDMCPVISQNSSPLEASMMETLRNKLQTIWQKWFKDKASLTQDEKEQFRNNAEAYISLVYRLNTDPGPVGRKLEFLEKIYQNILGQELNWSQNFKAFKATLDKKQKEQLAIIQDMSKNLEERREAFKEYIRVSRFFDINSFNQVVNKYFPKKDMPLEKESEVQNEKQDQARYSVLDREISAWVEKNKDNLSAVGKSEIQEVLNKIKELNTLAENLGEPQKFLRDLILLRQALSF